MTRAAIVIGINRTGGLPSLRAAASGAQQVGAWLSGEGFDVRSFIDDQGPVAVAAITQTITELVDKGTLTQLVVYFSGHGFLHNYSEFWMLSEAPRNPNEAVSFRETVDLARECGIPSVVLISDACRSTPQSLQAERVRGSLIFPNEPVSCQVRPEIDRFLAALPGDPALEMVVDETVRQHEGVFTRCFLQAYREPESEMVRMVMVDGDTVYFVPNRSLKRYLGSQVDAVMRAKRLRLRQIPDAIVESGDNVYIGRVAAPGDRTAKGAKGPSLGGLNIGDVVRVAVASAIGMQPQDPASVSPALDAIATASGFNASVELVRAARGPGHFETQAGFSVVGARVVKALGLDMEAKLLFGGDDANPGLVRLRPGPASVSSVALRFADGSGAVLAGLSGYIGTVLVVEGRVANVSYVPSENSWRWPEYLQKRTGLEMLRAIVAAAARLGVFRVERAEAASIADWIRYMKGVDPTLGLYAAYAYAEVGLRDAVESVRRYMGEDLAAQLFDVAMLGGKLAEPPSGGGRFMGGWPVVPFCPMLSQGWALLRVKRAKVLPAVAEAANHLLPALWTTFDPDGMNMVLKAIEEGNIR